MKRIILFVFLGLIVSLYAKNIPIQNANSEYFKITDMRETSLSLSYQISELDYQVIDKGGNSWISLSIEHYTPTSRIGEANLPFLRKIIAVPLEAEVEVKVISRKTQEIDFLKLKETARVIPVQPPLTKNIDPVSVAWIQNQAYYTQNTYQSYSEVKIVELGIMRGVRLVAVDFEPVSYNPGLNKINIVKDFQITLNFKNADLSATRELRDNSYSPSFDLVMQKFVINYRSPSVNFTRYPQKMVIISDPMFQAQLQPFIQWKIKQGIQIIEKYTNDAAVGTTTTSIKSYLQSLYNAGTTQNPAPTYLLLVGDTGQIPAWTGTTNTAHVTDLNYVRLSGTDYLPEMYYGRFSATNTSELQPQIDKTLMYEQYTMPNPAYLGESVLIAGVDATYGPTHGNGQINYATQNYYNTAHSINSHTYLYPTSGSSDAAIIALASQGMGFINYTAHGSETSWADPTFTVNDVSSLANTNKYGLVIGNCCLTNHFQTSVCLGESWLRAANKGAVAYIGATNNSLWDEDYWWGIGSEALSSNGTAVALDPAKVGVYDGLFHEHSEAFNAWFNTAGSMITCGNLAVSQTSSTQQSYYWEIYSLMGDPSLIPYYRVPSVNNVSSPAQILIGATSVQITADPYSYVCISKNNVIYGVGLTDATGNLVLSTTAFSSAGDVTLVVTKADRIPLTRTIPVIVNSGPYLTHSNLITTDTNNNIPEMGENISLSLTYNNIGTVVASNVNTTLTSSDLYISLTDNSNYVSSVAIGGSFAANNAFALTLANNIPDQHVVDLNFSSTNGTDTWSTTLGFTANAPVLTYGSMVINDAGGNNNGRLDPNETVTLLIPVTNQGHTSCAGFTTQISCSNPSIQLVQTTFTGSALSVGTSQNAQFQITVPANFTIGQSVTFTFATTYGAYQLSQAFNSSVGLMIEDFEAGNLSSYPWILSGNGNWAVTNSGAYSGVYCVKSPTLLDSQSASLSLNLYVTTAGTVKFYKLVSSESGYDYLKFYIDDVLQYSPGWSGTTDTWSQQTYSITTGMHTLKWTYSKDSSDLAGSDCAWLDDIVFPSCRINILPPTNLTITPNNHFLTLSWTAPNLSGIQGYNIYRNGQLVNSSPITTTSFIDSGLLNNTIYSYYLKTVFASGESDPSTAVNGTPAIPSGTTVTIGTGTTAQRLPVGMRYNYERSATIYTAAELTQAGVISKLAWQVQTAKTLVSPVKVYLKTTTATALTASTWSEQINGATLVFNDTLSFRSTGWKSFNITPFTYTGNNLIVLVEANRGSASATGTYPLYYYYTGGSQHQFWYSATSTPPTGTGAVDTHKPNIQVSFQAATTNPVVSGLPTSIAFGDIVLNQMATQSFSITNTGSASLIGYLNTPAVFPVAETISSTKQKESFKNILSFNIPTGQTKNYRLSFNPQVLGCFSGDLILNTNDNNNLTVSVNITGCGIDSGNLPPIFNIPADSLSFTRTDSLVINYLSYCSDPENAPLILSISNNVNLSYTIYNDRVVFRALNNWCGQENIYFRISDGVNDVNDVVLIRSERLYYPTWQPVIYPNNSATVYGLMTIDAQACQSGDLLGAFSDEECRGLTHAQVYNGQTYGILLINMASSTENISFRIYDESLDSVFVVGSVLTATAGGVFGSYPDALYLLNGTSDVSLSIPANVRILQNAGILTLCWDIVPNAVSYDVYTSDTPGSGFTLFTNTVLNSIELAQDSPYKFYYIKAKR